MTNRERLYKTLAHVQPDRVPTLIYARAEVERDLISHYGVQDFKKVLRILGADTYARLAIDAVFPGFIDKTNGVLQGDCPGAGKRYIFHDQRTFEDPWGVVRRVGSDGKYVQWITGPLAEADDPDEHDFLEQLGDLQLAYEFEGHHSIADADDFARRIKVYKSLCCWI